MANGSPPPTATTPRSTSRQGFVALDHELGEAAEFIGAEGLWGLPGGIDVHCHLDSPLGDGASHYQ